MSVAVVLKAGLASLVLLMPGCILTLALLKNRLSGFTNLILGLATGLVVLINLNVLISFLGGITRASLIISLLIVYLAALALLVIRKPSLPGLDLSSLKSSGNLLLLAVIGWSMLVRLIPLFFSSYPPGWDSSFHSLIAKIISLTKHIPTTWLPFEKIPLNYSWGAHVLINDINLLGGVELHQAFAVLNSVFFGGLSVAAVYMLAGLFYEDRLPAVMAALAYGILANWGSLNYYAWGGLPNQIGMFMFLCVSYLFLERRVSLAEKTILAGLLLSGIILIHGHAMLVSFYVIIFYIVLVLLTKKKIDADLKSMLASLVLAFFFSFYYSWRLIERVLTAQTSGLFRFKENLNVLELPLYVGIFLLIFFVIGFISYERKSGGDYLYLLSWEVSLCFAFAIFYYVWKIATKVYLGEVFVALTPSRFIADLVYPLSVLAGGGLATTIRGLTRNSVVSTVLLSVLLALVPFYYTGGLYRQALPTEVIDALKWVKENTPARSLIVNQPEEMWAAYISERESTFTPLPTTDLPDGRIFETKYGLPLFLSRGSGWSSYPGEKFVKEFGDRPVFFYTDKPISLEAFAEVYANKSVHVYKVDVPQLIK